MCDRRMKNYSACCFFLETSIKFWMSLQTAALVKDITVSNSLHILRGDTSKTHVQRNPAH